MLAFIAALCAFQFTSHIPKLISGSVNEKLVSAKRLYKIKLLKHVESTVALTRCCAARRSLKQAESSFPNSSGIPVSTRFTASAPHIRSFNFVARTARQPSAALPTMTAGR